MIFGRTETVQITYRATKDCFLLYEILPSRVAKQAIGPRVSWSWLAHFCDEKLVVVSTVVENCVSEDLLKTCASVELFNYQTEMTAIVMEDVSTAHKDDRKPVLCMTCTSIHHPLKWSCRCLVGFFRFPQDSFLEDAWTYI